MAQGAGQSSGAAGGESRQQSYGYSGQGIGVGSNRSGIFSGVEDLTTAYSNLNKVGTSLFDKSTFSWGLNDGTYSPTFDKGELAGLTPENATTTATVPSLSDILQYVNVSPEDNQAFSWSGSFNPEDLPSSLQGLVSPENWDAYNESGLVSALRSLSGVATGLIPGAQYLGMASSALNTLDPVADIFGLHGLGTILGKAGGFIGNPISDIIGTIAGDPTTGLRGLLASTGIGDIQAMGTATDNLGANIVDALRGGLGAAASFGGLNNIYANIFSNPNMVGLSEMAGNISNILGTASGLFDNETLSGILGLGSGLANIVRDPVMGVPNVMLDALRSGFTGEPTGILAGLSGLTGGGGGTLGTGGGGGTLGDILGRIATDRSGDNATRTGGGGQLGVTTTTTGGTISSNGTYSSPNSIIGSSTVADGSLQEMLLNVATSMFGNTSSPMDYDALQQALYDSVAGGLQSQEERQMQVLKDQMAERGVLDSGIWNESLGNLQGEYADLHEQALAEAAAQRYGMQQQGQYQERGQGIDIASLLMGDQINWANLALGKDQLNQSIYDSNRQWDAYGDEISAQEDSALWGSIGSLVGTFGPSLLEGLGGLLGGGSGSGLLSGLFGGGSSGGSTGTTTTQSGSSSTYKPSTSYTYTPSNVSTYQYTGQR